MATQFILVWSRLIYIEFFSTIVDNSTMNFRLQTLCTHKNSNNLFLSWTPQTRNSKPLHNPNLRGKTLFQLSTNLRINKRIYGMNSPNSWKFENHSTSWPFEMPSLWSSREKFESCKSKITLGQNPFRISLFCESLKLKCFLKAWRVKIRWDYLYFAILMTLID